MRQLVIEDEEFDDFAIVFLVNVSVILHTCERFSI